MPFFRCTICRPGGSPVAQHVMVMIESGADSWYGTISGANLTGLAAGERYLSMVFVALPSLEVCLVRQTYRTVSVGDSGPVGQGQAVVNFASESFQADLTVDADGLVLEYPGLARRA